MNGLSVRCPACNTPVEVTQALAAPLLEAERKGLAAQVAQRLEEERSDIAQKAAAEATVLLDAKLKASEAANAEKDQMLRRAVAAELAAREAKDEAERSKRERDALLQSEIDAASKRAAAVATERAAGEYLSRIREAEVALAAKDARLKEAQDAELDARRSRQEAEDAKRQMELAVQRRVDAERAAVRESALKERDEEHRFTLAEKEKQLADLRCQIEEARRKANSTAPQLSGGVLERDIYESLKIAFPGDRLDAVKKGQNGADVLQTVVSPSGVVCGAILWETKRTKAWSTPWLSKAREDQRAQQADIAVIATETLPAGIDTFGTLEGVWVTGIPTIVPLAEVLRHALVEVSTARRAGTIVESARDSAFAYLVGPLFRQRVVSIYDVYKEARETLDAERRATERHWAAREKQLSRLIRGLAGCYGDLQGIALVFCCVEGFDHCLVLFR